MRSFLVVILILITLLYAQYYLKYKHDYEILQVQLDNFKLQMLYEKYPIVIFDRVYQLNDLLKTVFAYSFLFQKEIGIQPDKVHRNKHKYLILNSDDEVVIKLINPKYKNEIKENLNDCNVQFISVKLKEHQCLVVPALWYYHTDHIDVRGIEMDDLLSGLIYTFI